MFDIHCHVLHGVDDGAKDLNDSMLICRLDKQDGVDTIVATPHYIDGESVVETSTVLSMVQDLNREIGNVGLDVTVLPGMEVYIVPNLADLYEKNKIITLNNKGYMLIELPLYESVPAYIEDVIFELQLKGIKVIIAHPERYRSVKDHPNTVYRLIEKGCYMQMNAGSILGQFGNDVQKTASILLEHNMVHIISSDNHSGTTRISSLKECSDYVSRKLGKAAVRKLFGGNAQKVVNGEELEIDEPERVNKKKFFIF